MASLKKKQNVHVHVHVMRKVQIIHMYMFCVYICMHSKNAIMHTKESPGGV